jgi:hypothetical protein
MKEIDLDDFTPDKISKMNSRTLRLRDVYARTPDRYKDRALGSARTRSLKRRINRADGRLVILSVIYTTLDSNGNRKANPDMHYQVIQQLSKGRTLWDSKCKVSCSCLDFLFTDEVSLFKRANSDVRFSNGELPVIKNPRMIPQVCKHLVHLTHVVRNKGW